MTFSSVRTALQSNGRLLFKDASIRSSTKRGSFAFYILRRSPTLRRSLSTTTSTSSEQKRRRLIPIRHSSKGPPLVCRDDVELQELTQELLESPVGSLFCQSTVKTSLSRSDDRGEAYERARESGELVEYLLRGFNRTISPLTLCGNGKTADANKSVPDEVSASLEKMMNVMERFHQEGEMYLRLRREALAYSATTYSDSSSDSESSDSSSDSSNSETNDDFLSKSDDYDQNNDTRFSTVVKDKLEVDARDQKQRQRQRHLHVRKDDFAMPGVTTTMYDTILDAMACAAQVSLESSNTNQSVNTSSSESPSFLQMLEPEDLYRVAGLAWEAHYLNNQYNSGDFFFPSTTPTMVTYNATLRGIGNICSSSTLNGEQKALITDQGLAHGFGVYNHLTHNDQGLPKRNAASIVYLLKIIEACIPPSRTRGNMTVALWHQASMEGLVTSDLIRSIKDLHNISNGPEFDVFLESLDKCTASAGEKTDKVVITPQRFARFAKKYSHSKFY